MQALYEAVRANDTARVEALVADDPKLAIFAAALMDDGAEIETILGANRSLMTATSTDGWTPLHLAAHFGREHAARSLLSKGADVNVRSSNALHNFPLHAAAAGGAVGVAKLLIERGANVNARQQSGWTPLHAAAQSGNLELAQVLVDAGADVNVRADNQQRPLDLALTKGQQGMVQYLEAQGATL
jgi:ankyrin repeat protein